MNGIASVLASVLGVVVAINFGYRGASLAAAACYLFALGHAAVGRWASATGEAAGSLPGPEPDSRPMVA